jgi:prepilin peptidase CpaA
MQNIFWFILIVLCGFAVYLDVVNKKIPNWLSLGGVLLGVVGGVIFLGFGSLPSSSFGLLYAIVLGGIFWALGMWGGGDHKLFMAAGAFMGWPAILFVSIIMAISGGVEALILLLSKKKSMPYSISIFAGVVFYILYKLLVV